MSRDAVGRGRKASRQMRVFKLGARVDPDAETMVPCPCCGKGLMSATRAAQIRQALADAGIAPWRSPSAPPDGAP